MSNKTPDMVEQPLAILAEHGRTFHFASHLLGKTFRLRAAKLYAFCRYIDDLADKTQDPQLAKKRLQSLRRDLSLRASAHERCAQMLALAEETSMPMTPVLALIDGAMQDLSPVSIPDERALIQYAYQVAGTVGLMMCSVLDVKDAQALPYAIDLGIAMQLTNIARDVGEWVRTRNLGGSICRPSGPVGFALTIFLIRLRFMPKRSRWQRGECFIWLMSTTTVGCKAFTFCPAAPAGGSWWPLRSIVTSAH